MSPLGLVKISRRIIGVSSSMTNGATGSESQLARRSSRSPSEQPMWQERDDDGRVIGVTSDCGIVPSLAIPDGSFCTRAGVGIGLLDTIGKVHSVVSTAAGSASPKADLGAGEAKWMLQRNSKKDNMIRPCRVRHDLREGISTRVLPGGGSPSHGFG